MSDEDDRSKPVPTTEKTYINSAYAEICRSFHALDDFRMKLLGLLPIASIVGLLALGRSTATPHPTAAEIEILGYVGVFSALFTLALFGYEVRGILMCHDLNAAGAALETLMGISGQFTTCDEKRSSQRYNGRFKRWLARRFNGNVTPCAVYSLVFAAWLFVGLRYGFNIHVDECVRWAAGVGIAITVATSVMLYYLTTPRKRTAETSSNEVAEAAAV
jgi:hypothetical protein